MFMVDESEFEQLKKKERLLKDIEPQLKELLKKSDTQGAYLAKVTKTVQSILRSMKVFEKK
jgi:hypothetical protein